MNLDARIAGAGQAVEDEGDDADDQAALEGHPEAVHLERGDKFPGEQKQGGVDDQKEKAERDDLERQRHQRHAQAEHHVEGAEHAHGREEEQGTEKRVHEA